MIALLAIVAAVGATSLALPGGPVPHLIWVALAPLAWLLPCLTPVRAAGAGYLYGLLSWVLVLQGWTGAAEGMLGLSPGQAVFATLVLAAISAAPFAGIGLLATLLPSGKTARAAGFAAAGTIMMSWVPGLLPGNPAHALHLDPAALQLLAIGGTPLLLLAVLLVNGLAAEAVRTRDWRPLLAGASLVAVIQAGGAWWLDRPAPGDGTPIRIAGIQPGIGRGDHPAWILPDERQRVFDHLTAMTEAAAALSPDLIVWAEQPAAIAIEQEAAVSEWITGLARRIGRPILVPGAALTGATYPNGIAADLSRAWLVDATGSIAAYHDKVHLVPFAEYLPLERELPWLRRLLPFPRYTQPGATARPIPLADGIKAIVAICYEAVFREDMRVQANAGGNIILNPVNDMWFGDSRLSDWHLAITLFRTVELGIPLARIANTGQTVFVDRAGRIAAEALPAKGQPAIAVTTLAPATATTPYARFGDIPLWLLTAGFAAWLVICRGRRRGSPRRGDAHRPA